MTVSCLYKWFEWKLFSNNFRKLEKASVYFKFPLCLLSAFIQSYEKNNYFATNKQSFETLSLWKEEYELI